MRDKQFITEPRGGLLNKDQHRLLMLWACDCSWHVLPFFVKTVDKGLLHALEVATVWKQGNATVGEAREASVAAYAVASKAFGPVSVAVARSVRHAVATAHRSDHSHGAARYALKAVKNAGRPVDAERKWQDEQLALPVRELVLTARSIKNI